MRDGPGCSSEGRSQHGIEALNQSADDLEMALVADNNVLIAGPNEVETALPNLALEVRERRVSMGVRNVSTDNSTSVDLTGGKKKS